jgi:hypothetical protein
MLKETHYPSNWTVTVVFLVIFLLIVGVFAWAFYFNLGTIRVEANQTLQMTVNGDAVKCLENTCEVTLPPAVYQISLSSSGYYEQSFPIEVLRFQTINRQITFDLIPYLSDFSASLPQKENLKFEFISVGLGSGLFESESGDLVTSFDSLIDPDMSLGEGYASIVDDGRLFFVDLKTGRKQRRFDDDLKILRSHTSPDGIRSIIFALMDEQEYIWMWFHDNNELQPITWLTQPNLFQWRGDLVNSAYVITDELSSKEDESFLNDLLDVAETIQSPLSLYSYNFDTDKVQFVVRFDEDKIPQELHKINERYFIEYDDDSYDELIVAENI